MAFLVQFSLQGEKQLARFLGLELPRKIKIAKGNFLKRSGDIVINRSKHLFSTSGSGIETAPPWAKLAPATVRSKAKKGFSSKPLIGSGKLSSGMTKKVVTGKNVTVTNKFMNQYGKYHQSNAPRRKIPRRAFLELDNRSRTNIIRLIQTDIHNALNPGRSTTTSLK